MAEGGTTSVLYTVRGRVKATGRCGGGKGATGEKCRQFPSSSSSFLKRAPFVLRENMARNFVSQAGKKNLNYFFATLSGMAARAGLKREGNCANKLLICLCMAPPPSTFSSPCMVAMQCFFRGSIRRGRGLYETKRGRETTSLARTSSSVWWCLMAQHHLFSM